MNPKIIKVISDRFYCIFNYILENGTYLFILLFHMFFAE